MGHLRTPWTPEQVNALNDYQTAGWGHPFTCAHCRSSLGATSSRYALSTGVNTDHHLIATDAGWVCETCDYTQDWAHEFMAENRNITTKET